MKPFLITFTFCFIFLCGFAQKYRVISYPDIEANRLLYDTTDNFSLKRLVNLTVTPEFPVRDGEFYGISPEDAKKIEAVSGSLVMNEDFWWKLGEQGINPLKDRYGYDSTLYLQDGTIEYVYPARDTIWFYNNFNEVAVKEEIVTNGTDITYVPQTLILYYTFPENLRIRVAVVSFDLLRKEKVFTEPLQKDSSARLIREMDRYFRNAEDHFETDWCFNKISMKSLVNHRNDLLYDVWEGDHFDGTMGRILDAPEVYPHFDITYRLLVTVYGEDSVVFNPEKSEWIPAYSADIDSSFFFTGHFENAYFEKFIGFDRKTNSWIAQTNDILFTKDVLRDEKPVLVYSSQDMEMQFPLVSSQYDVDPRRYYYKLNEPAYKMIANQEKEIVTVGWWNALFDHSLVYKTIMH